MSISRYRGTLKAIIIAIISLFSIFNCHTLVLQVKYEHTPVNHKHKPLISFIIPSTLARNDLNRTIESLQRLRELNWEAIIGVDVRKSIYNSTDHIHKRRRYFSQDRRLQWVPIDVNDTDRGAAGNGSGNVRNVIVKQFAAADWVAFVDDDDSLSESYISLLARAQELFQGMDIFIFRMLGGTSSIIPPYAHGHVAALNNVGISFAVRRDLFVRRTWPITFTPSSVEDYLYLRKAQDHNATIMLSCNVTYFIRRRPIYVESDKSCTTGRAFITEYVPKENLGGSGNWSEHLRRWYETQDFRMI